MTLHSFEGRLPQGLLKAMPDFEARFTYPLGPNRSFHISHGEDPHRFFRAMGEAACFILEEGERVLGAAAVALRSLLLPDGGESLVAYIGDLKILPEARGGRVLWRLAQAIDRWSRPRVNAAFGVVMEGTPRIPPAYSGRLGIPSFEELARVKLFRLPSRAAATVGGMDRFVAEDSMGEACYRRLSRSRYASLGGVPSERSILPPIWLVLPDQTACGRLEDTRRAKKLFLDNGSELVSAHLASFAFAEPRAGVKIIEAALERTQAAGYPGLFFAVAWRDVEGLRKALGTIDTLEASATIYGTGLSTEASWNLNSSEI